MEEALDEMYDQNGYDTYQPRVIDRLEDTITAIRQTRNNYLNRYSYTIQNNSEVWKDSQQRAMEGIQTWNTDISQVWDQQTAEDLQSRFNVAFQSLKDARNANRRA